MPGLSRIVGPLVLSGKWGDISCFDNDPGIVGIESDEQHESSTGNARVQHLPGLPAIGRAHQRLVGHRPADLWRDHVQLG